MRREVNDLAVSELERLADYMSTHTHNQYNNQNIHFLSLSDFCVLHRHDKIFIFIRSYSVISVRCRSSCPPTRRSPVCPFYLEFYFRLSHSDCR